MLNQKCLKVKIQRLCIINYIYKLYIIFFIQDEEKRLKYLKSIGSVVIMNECQWVKMDKSKYKSSISPLMYKSKGVTQETLLQCIKNTYVNLIVH